MDILWASSIIFSLVATFAVHPALDPLFRTMKHHHLVNVAVIASGFLGVTVNIVCA